MTLINDQGIQPSKTEHAIIYIRVSSERQVDNASLETQERTCKEMCARYGWPVLQVFREKGESAKTTNRTEFQKALHYCRTHNPRPRFFVVYHTDRFSRKGTDHDVVRQTLVNWGVLLRSVCQQLGEKPMDKFIERIWSGQAELDNDIRKEKTLGGMETRLTQGSWTFKAPLGFVNSKKLGVKTITPDPERAPLVREAFERFAMGQHKRQAVLEWINDKGLRTWEGKRVTAETFRRMLANPLYAGRIVVQGKQQGAGEEWRFSQKGTFEAIISEELFDKVQGLLTGRRPSIAPRRRTNPDFPLCKFVRCGSCDRPLTGSKSTGRSGDKYGYYHCQNKNCPEATRVRKETLEADFMLYLGQLRPNREYMREFHVAVIAVYEEKFKESLDVRDRLERDLRENREKKRKLNEAYLYRGVISEADYREMRESVEEEILALEMKISEARQDEIEIEELLRFTERLFFHATDSWMDSGIEGKVRLQKILFPKGVAYSDGEYRTATTNPLFNLLGKGCPEKGGLVAQVSANWNHVSTWLCQMDLLRKSSSLGEYAESG